jgi:hypothetical protein
MRECKAEGCPHIAADGCEFCKQHDELGAREAETEAVARALSKQWNARGGRCIYPSNSTAEDWIKSGDAQAALDALRSSGSAAQPTTEEREAYMRGYRAAKAGLTPKPEGESGSAAQNQEPPRKRLGYHASVFEAQDAARSPQDEGHET